MGKKGTYTLAKEAQAIYLNQFNIAEDKVLIHPQDFDEEQQRTTASKLYGEVVMGVPVGSHLFVKNHIVTSILPKMRRDFQKTEEACREDPQLHLLLLKMVLTNKTSHLLRGLTPCQAAPVISEFERLQRIAICSIAGVHEISDLSFDLARTTNGLGLSCTADICDAAFVSSMIASREVVEEAVPGIFGAMDDGNLPLSMREFHEAVSRLHDDDSSFTLDSLLATPASHYKHLQAKLSAPRKRRKEAEVEVRVMAAGQVEAAIWTSGNTVEARAWFDAIPKCEALTMRPINFQTAVRNRLLISHPCITEGTPCPCTFGAFTDPLGIHLQKCGLQSGLSDLTHDQLKLTLNEFSRAMGLCTRMEPKDLLRAVDPNDRRKPADLAILEAGKPLQVRDVRVTNAVTKALERGTVLSSVAGSAARKSEREKHGKYDAACTASGYDFKAFVFEVQGRFGEEFSKWFYKLIHKRSQESGAPPSALATYWTRRIAVTLQNGVTNEIVTRAHKLAMGVSVTEAHGDESGFSDVVLNQRDVYIRGLGIQPDG